jgi:hypothetical protein
LIWAFALGFWILSFWLLALGFFWLFGYGRLLEGKIAGRRLLKGINEWLKGRLLKGK